ncbi:MAG: YfhO family protein, partial [Fimbriimonadales bacterium]|nr:YfhO family protein [Fimbriimonadales bacterium]
AHLRVRFLLTPDGWQSLPPAPVRLQPLELLPDEEAVWSRLQANPFPDAIPVSGEAAQRAVRTYGQGTLVENARVEWVDYRATRLLMRVRNPSSQTAWLLLTDTWYPGWQARVNGEPVPLLQANGAFRAVPVPPGEATVTMWFMPRSFVVGAWLSAASLVALAIVPVARWRKRPDHSRRVRLTAGGSSPPARS